MDILVDIGVYCVFVEKHSGLVGALSMQLDGMKRRLGLLAIDFKQHDWELIKPMRETSKDTGTSHWPVQRQDRPYRPGSRASMSPIARLTGDRTKED